MGAPPGRNRRLEAPRRRRAIGRGRRIISAEARVFDANRRILARGTSTIIVLSGVEAPPIAS
jgi:acyl-coenzyme A thioesterase PaaI-like protein